MTKESGVYDRRFLSCCNEGQSMTGMLTLSVGLTT